jgi:hypothetical protein
VLTAAEGGTLGHGVACVSSSVSLPLIVKFHCMNSDVSNLNL